MHFLKYLKFFTFVVLLILSSIATLNFFVDPAGLYYNKNLSSDKYASALLDSENGLFLPQGLFSERDLVKSLIKHSQPVDCVVIGSSHVMQISSVRNNSSLKDLCKTILNISVSGASIEDHITLAYMATKAKISNKIILGVDPWTLTYGKDIAWQAYIDDYGAARHEIFGKTANIPKSTMLLITNLLNIKYTLRSIALLDRFMRNGLPTINQLNVSESNHNKTIYDSYKLSDGSLVSIKTKKRPEVTVNSARSHTYKVRGPVSLPAAVNDYQTLLEWIYSFKVSPYILLTPYHPLAWNYADTRLVSVMNETEGIIKNVADNLKIKVYGSYNPSKVDCSKDEFFDIMHAKDTCLSKIKTD
jgi:hypothetical protein